MVGTDADIPEAIQTRGPFFFSAQQLDVSLLNLVRKAAKNIPNLWANFLDQPLANLLS